MPSFSVDGAINSLELTARVTVNDVKINISFGVDGEKDRVDARRLYALWLRFGARRSGRVKNATTLLVKSAPQRLGAAIHAVPSCKPVPDGLSMLEFRLQTFLTRFDPSAAPTHPKRESTETEDLIGFHLGFRHSGLMGRQIPRLFINKIH